MKNKLRLALLLLCLTLALTGCSGAGTALPQPEAVAAAEKAPVLPPINNTDKFKGKTLYEYYCENQDTIGWLTIPGIKTDNIIMQGQNKSYDVGEDGINHYLYRTFSHQSSTGGEMYIDHRNNITHDFLCKNITVYGHHMRDGSMLAGLDYYMKESYFKDHQYFTFHTLWGTYHYRVFGVFVVNLKVASDRAFDFRQLEFESDQEFLDFIQEVKDRSYYDTGVTVEADDKIINLCTCTYPTGNPSVDDARLIVMGRLCTDEAEIKAAQEALANN